MGNHPSHYVSIRKTTFRTLVLVDDLFHRGPEIVSIAVLQEHGSQSQLDIRDPMDTDSYPIILPVAPVSCLARKMTSQLTQEHNRDHWTRRSLEIPPFEGYGLGRRSDGKAN